MTYEAKILADSLSPDDVRLTTFEVTVPRIVLAELNTHRDFSRNSASSRAIPVKKMIKRVMEHPYIPSTWGKNQKGMQSEEEVSPELASMAKQEWLRARDKAVEQAVTLGELGIHKQFTNRLLEPFMWHTVIITATRWDNFWHLRCHKDAHPDIRKPAELMRKAMEESEPRKHGEWHLPLVPDFDDLVSDWHNDKLGKKGDELWDLLCKISIARCARVSYLTHDGKRDPNKDVELYKRLTTGGHMSPLEHVARPMTEKESRYYKRQVAVLRNGNRINIHPGNVVGVGTQMGIDVGASVEKIEDTYFCGNFNRWVQYRKTIPGEHDMLGHLEAAE